MCRQQTFHAYIHIVTNTHAHNIDRMHMIIIKLSLSTIEIVCVLRASTLVAEDGTATEAHKCAKAV